MNLNTLISPHGGKLLPLIVGEGNKKQELLTKAKKYTKIYPSSKELSDINMLGTGAFSPLNGFMKKEDYLSVLDNMELCNGILWPIPVTISVDKDIAKSLKEGQQVSLYNKDRKEISSILTIDDIYEYNKEKEAKDVFRTTDHNHPGVEKLYCQGEVYLGGKIVVLSDGGYSEKYKDFGYPKQTRDIFIQKGWKTISALQTRNPMHRSHEYLSKIALEVTDGLFINPIVGKLKEDDIPAEIRMECYQVLINKYFPLDRVVLKVYAMEMRYAGPKEAVLHAIIRQNFGCTHFIIGRDHAGVGDYYRPFDAQDIFDEIDNDKLKIKLLKLDWTFWCYKCDSMASIKTCPHSKKDRLLISGTKLREILSKGEYPPKEFSRPEIIEILKRYYKNNDRKS